MDGIERCIDDELPFDIPDSWEWVRLSFITKLLGGYAFKSNEYSLSGIRIIRISDFDETGLLFKDFKFSAEDSRLEAYEINSFDILMCMTGGTVGKTCLLEEISQKLYLNQRVAVIRNTSQISTYYLYYCLITPHIKENIKSSKTSTNDNISMQTIGSFLIPVPPLQEQHRIARHLDTLFNNIDALRQQ